MAETLHQTQGKLSRYREHAAAAHRDKEDHALPGVRRLRRPRVVDENDSISSDTETDLQQPLVAARARSRRLRRVGRVLSHRRPMPIGRKYTPIGTDWDEARLMREKLQRTPLVLCCRHIAHCLAGEPSHESGASGAPPPKRQRDAFENLVRLLVRTARALADAAEKVEQCHHRRQHSMIHLSAVPGQPLPCSDDDDDAPRIRVVHHFTRLNRHIDKQQLWLDCRVLTKKYLDEVSPKVPCQIKQRMRHGRQPAGVELADFQRVYDVNVKAIFLCAKAVLPSMLKSGYGRIVNIASISGKDGNAGMLAYSSSKAAVINLTKVMGKEYANLGKDITINCIAPAVVQTAMVDAMPPEQVKYMTDKIPMGRTGKLDEVAATILFAASQECSFTTGFCFDASGGRTVY
eukprot:s332_g13.t1